ncbi:hypothetical protein ABEB36_009034 [Hypothenemus hampei]|uniref:Uncharacterized protein n=1 Tax=Hypothenemus hampei TaxID=57062 RepID=A0ABD1ENV8_HYPHA
MKNVYVIVFVLIGLLGGQSSSAKSKKKSTKTTTQAPEATSPQQPAIIAIEIVDPNENSTTKQSKRTIETALGYGYNSYDKPRYEVYKYSQHDIPPYKGDTLKLYSETNHNSVNSPITIQKSVEYTLPTITEPVLKPGTTLYSSVNTKGETSDLTSSLSKVSGLENNNNPVPVVVLRIYPDQLKDSTIQANLPNNHPFAKVINSINLQTLLLPYIKAAQGPVTSQAYSTPVNNYYYNQQQGYRQEYYQNQRPESNYAYNRVQVQSAPVKYQFRYNTPAVPARKAHPQFYYVQPTETVPSSTPQYYPQQDYHPQQVYQQQQQQEQDYQSQQEYYPEQYSSPNLPTNENYPSDKHTKVIFRGQTGNIRNSEQDFQIKKEVKTIKIEVPQDVVNVEVKETERPYYNYPEYDNQQGTNYPEYDNQQGNYYDENQDSVRQQALYGQGDTDRPADEMFNYQNIDYEQMAKYFTRKGAMPSYFFQNPEQETDNSKVKLTNLYEDASFSTVTTQSSQEKRKRSKKGS